MSGPLTGLRVLEFAAIGPVPWSCMILADLGADIIRIERPGSEREPDTLGAVRRGRRCLSIDLKSTQGHEAALHLAAHADVLLEGLRPGTMERLGLGPAEAMARNPRLVYGRMTGWGQTGPLADRAGHDINYIALTGALHAIGPSDRPVPPLNLVGDFGGGGAMLLIGVLSALFERASSGRGQVIDAAMVDGSAALMAMIFSRLRLGQWKDDRARNPLDGGVPWYDTYRTADGRFMAVGALEPQFYSELVAGLGLTGEVPDRSDCANWPEIRHKFAKTFATRTRDEWAAHFAASDACVSPVLSLAEAPQHPHLAHRGTFSAWQDGAVPGPALVFDGVRATIAGNDRSATWHEVAGAWGADTQ